MTARTVAVSKESTRKRKDVAGASVLSPAPGTSEHRVNTDGAHPTFLTSPIKPFRLNQAQQEGHTGLGHPRKSAIRDQPHPHLGLDGEGTFGPSRWPRVFARARAKFVHSQQRPCLPLPGPIIIAIATGVGTHGPRVCAREAHAVATVALSEGPGRRSATRGSCGVRELGSAPERGDLRPEPRVNEIRLARAKLKKDLASGTVTAAAVRTPLPSCAVRGHGRGSGPVRATTRTKETCSDSVPERGLTMSRCDTPR